MHISCTISYLSSIYIIGAYMHIILRLIKDLQ
jgi:hypothetical protein